MCLLAAFADTRIFGTAAPCIGAWKKETFRFPGTSQPLGFRDSGVKPMNTDTMKSRSQTASYSLQLRRLEVSGLWGTNQNNLVKTRNPEP